MVKAVIISAVAGFSLPYFIDISIPGIPLRQIIPLPIETGIRSRSNSAHDTIFSSQVVNRSQKGDKLEVLHTSQRPIDQERDPVQKTITPDSRIKIGFESLRFATSTPIRKINKPQLGPTVGAKVVVLPVQSVNTVSTLSLAQQDRSAQYIPQSAGANSSRYRLY